MAYPRWQTARSQLSDYQPKRPWDSPLYRLIYQYRDYFEYQWGELFEHQYGALRKEVLSAFDAYLNCGVVAHGVVLVACESCPHGQILAFSCKKRGLCPSCDAKRACIFAEHLHENVLLPYSHRHLVWTIPKRLRIYFKFNRKLNKYLYWAANKAWNEYLCAVLPNGKTGTISALHTAGDNLGWHPHNHMLVLNGVVNQDGQFIELAEIDTAKLEVLFANKLFHYLLEEGLITEDVVENMKSWSHSGFNVYAPR